MLKRKPFRLKPVDCSRPLIYKGYLPRPPVDTQNIQPYICFSSPDRVQPLQFFSPSRIFLFKYKIPPAFVKLSSSVHTVYLCQQLSCQEAIEKFLLNNEHMIFSKYNYHHQKYQFKKNFKQN